MKQRLWSLNKWFGDRENERFYHEPTSKAGMDNRTYRLVDYQSLALVAEFNFQSEQTHRQTCHVGHSMYPPS